MGMATATNKWTAAMVRALPDDGNRYEVIDGELFVTPAPTWSHQRGVRDMYDHVREYLRHHPVGDVLFAPAEVEFDEHRMVEPDLFVTPLVAGRLPRSWEEVRALLLVVEVLSPGTARADRNVKRRLYQRQRVPEYWIVDVDARLLERWRPDDSRPEILSASIEWQPDPAHPSLAIDLPAYFSGVIGSRQ